MKEIKKLGDAYNSCVSNGLLQDKRIADTERVIGLIDLAKQDIEMINYLNKSKPDHINTLFKLYYNVLRSLLDSYVLFDKISSSNHQCINAYICQKHKSLDLDWNELETIRILRNNLTYEGIPLNPDDWKRYKIILDLYIKLLKREVEKKLKGRNKF